MKEALIRKTKSGWRWRVRARNGRIVAASSEAFTRRRACEKNLRNTAKMLADAVAGMEQW